uniref:Capsid protein n=1 Tax=Coleura bat circovirus TaxID=3141865 RepID=A0AAU7E2S0_9CIRC
MLSTSAETSFVIKPSLSDFDEANVLKDSFESYRIHSLKLRIIPHFNVSSGQSNCPPYYIAPYKTDIDRDKLTEGSILTLDKCRTHHGWRGSVHNYVPAVLSDISYVGTGGTVFNSTSKTNWRPRMEINCGADKIPHYAAILIFAKQPNKDTPAPFYRNYTFQLSAKISFYNQRKIVNTCQPPRNRNVYTLINEPHEYIMNSSLFNLLLNALHS